MKTPKLVICDVDGTIFDRKDTVTEGLIHLRTIIKKHKIPFTLASGRCYTNLKNLSDYLGVDLPVIVNNGTGIMDENTLFWSASINQDDIKEAVEYADQCGMLISFCNAREEIIYRHNEYVQSYIERFQKSYQFCHTAASKFRGGWPDFEVQKLLIIDCQKPGRVDEVISKIKKRNDTLSIVRYDDRSIDVMPGGCGKRSGVERLSQMLGIKMEDIMAIGDNENDLEMLSAVGLGVAVQNATETLKRVADYVCHQDAAAGVAEAVGKAFSGQD